MLVARVRNESHGAQCLGTSPRRNRGMMPEEQVTTFVRRALGFPAAHELSDADWRAMLSFSDRNQLTLFLDGSTAPDWMLDELRIRTFKNKQRYDDLRAAFE